MEENLIEPTYEVNKQGSLIKVIGVGGAGCNAVQHMAKEGIFGVDFVVCNTDKQNLESKTEVPTKLLLGTTGLGAGADPQKAKELAEEATNQINSLIGDNTKMIFIVAGMGKGTGTGASPVIARLARERGILTIGVVTYPYNLEQAPTRNRADQGIEELKKYVDSLLVVNNQKVMEEYYDLRLSAGLALANDVLKNAVKSVAELITVEGYQNADFSDVESVMRDSGDAMIGVGEASGEFSDGSRAEEVVRAAMTCPILNDVDIKDAQRFLLFLRYPEGGDPTYRELEKISQEISQYISEGTHLIFGHSADKSLTDNTIKLSVIMTHYQKRTQQVKSLTDGGNDNNNFPNMPSNTPTASPTSGNYTPNTTPWTSTGSSYDSTPSTRPVPENRLDISTIGQEAIFAKPEPTVHKPQEVAPAATTEMPPITPFTTGVQKIDKGQTSPLDDDNTFNRIVHTPAYRRQQDSIDALSNSRFMEMQSEAVKVKPQPSYSSVPTSESIIFGGMLVD